MKSTICQAKKLRLYSKGNRELFEGFNSGRARSNLQFTWNIPAPV